MPNHIHTIAELNNQNRINCDGIDGVDGHVETHGRASLQSVSLLQSASLKSSLLASSPDILNQIIKRNPAIRLPKSISSFIAGFKSAVNTKIDDYIDEI